ncbi:MAG: hypothetical protein M3O50_22665 [Myxococcota bacterium]|nr:hypothetical protein [Myxococcota bacterium]
MLAKAVAPTRCATDGQNVYWLEAGGAANVSGVSVQPGGMIFNVAINQNNPSALRVDATNVYWSAGGSILEAPKNGTSSMALAIALNQGAVQYIAVDNNFVYWVSGGTAVVKTPIGGGAITTLVPAVSGGLGIAVDGTSVYWTETGSRSVRKVTPK